MENEYLKQRRKEINTFTFIFQITYIVFSIIHLTGALREYYALIEIIEIISIVLATIGICIRPHKVERTKFDSIISVAIYISFILASIKLIVKLFTL